MQVKTSSTSRPCGVAYCTPLVASNGRCELIGQIDERLIALLFSAQKMPLDFDEDVSLAKDVARDCSQRSVIFRGAQAASLSFAATCRKLLPLFRVLTAMPSGKLPDGAGRQPALPKVPPALH